MRRSDSRFRRGTSSQQSANRRNRRRRRVFGFEKLEDRALLTLAGQQLFPADNPWNQNIANAPVAANSQAIINNIISLAGDRSLHPDFSQDYGTNTPLYGIPYNIVHGNTQPKVHVVIDAYADQSDLQDAPIPPNAILEGDMQNGPTVGAANRGDSHLIVFDVDNDIAYEFYNASRPSENADGHWHADSEAVWDMKKDSFRTIGWGSADAAGLPILPGLARPDEGLPVSQGGQGAIDHAIRFTLRGNIILDQFLYPAEHVADPHNHSAAIQPPMGARFRLKADVDISHLDPESQVIAQAMKTYGLILADNGSNFFFSGASESVEPDGQTLTWNDSDIQSTLHGLASLHASDFEVVDLTPRVSGLSASSGPAGSILTISGQNFSGAAGHLQVLFGDKSATNVTIVDDGHLTVTVPMGAGTVDVRVQSGVTTASSDPENINDPIFGYGISAVSAADKFTYTGPQTPIAVNDTASTTANVPLKINVLANDYDPDGDKLFVTSVTQPSNGTAGINVDNTVTYTPAAGFTGTDTFTYTVSDGKDGTDTGTVTVGVTSSVPVKWFVNVGDPGYVETGNRWVDGWGTDPAGDRYRNASPVDASWATPSTATWSVSGLQPGTYGVYATWVTSPYYASNAPFTVLDGSAALATLAVNEEAVPDSLTDGGRGWKNLGTYTINSGTLSLRLTNNDANGTVTADALRLVMVSQPTNQPPVAVNDTASTTAGAPVTINVLANDSDPDGDKLSVASVTQPAHGTAVINSDNTVTYTPAAGFTGSDTFNYAASDGRGGTATASVTVSVAAANASKWFVNVGDPGYVETGNRWVSGWGTDPAGHPYRNASPVDSSWATPSTATWSVVGLAPGTYQVYATWIASPYFASNAPFTVSDGSKPLANMPVNEQVAPSDLTDGGRGWKSLGTFSVASGTLAVQLSNNRANDNVTADAIRIVRVS